jgi:hypothetical protein
MFAPITQEARAQGAKTPNNSNCRTSKRGSQYVPCSMGPHRPARSARCVKQDWEKLYRAAVLESDRSKLLRRVEGAEAAIRKRSRSLSKPPGNDRKEQDAITRALHILSLLREAGQEQ